jgi:phage I-like protein
MTKATATAIFNTDLASEAKAAPDWVELFPAGPEIQARDGRKWTADPAAVLASFQANNGPLAIDYEHGQDILAENGQEAPAAGWIIELDDRAGAVWAKVEWTARAAKMIAEREYRYLSPAFNHTKDGRVSGLLGAGLVNRPALVMTALSRKTSKTNEENDMKAIAKALGLGEDADEAAILAAITARGTEQTELCKALKLDPEKADAAAVLAAISKLAGDLETATARAQGKTEGGDAELAALKTQLADTQKALTSLQKKDADREIDAALDEAASAGKITPASRETYRAMCATDGGLERFKALAATLPVICDPTDLDTSTATTTGADDEDPVALAARARKYQDEQCAAGRNIDTATAVIEVKAGADKKETAK